MDVITCAAPNCGAPAEWFVASRGVWRMRCTRCGHVFEPPARAQVARAADDVQRAVKGKPWSTFKQ